jgi:hypothetical protein
MRTESIDTLERVKDFLLTGLRRLVEITHNVSATISIDKKRMYDDKK